MYGRYTRRVLSKAMLLAASLAIPFSVFPDNHQDGTVPDRRGSWDTLAKAEAALASSESSRKDAEKTLWRIASQAKSNKPDASAAGCRALALLSRAARNAVGYEISSRESLLPTPAFLREGPAVHDPKDTAKISRALAKFEDYSAISKWDYDADVRGRHSNPALLPFIEAAYLTTLRASTQHAPESFREALKMLSHADTHSKGIDKAESLCQLAELMREIREFRRAESYLRDSLAYGTEWFKITATSPGSEPAKRPGHDQWASLKARIQKLQLLLELDLIEQDYGEQYAMYVKMRTFVEREDWWLAFPVAVKLKDDFPDSVYGQYARLAWCRMLLLNDTAGKFAVKSLPSGTAELNKFISDNPFGLYRGDAHVELGKFHLEQKYDAKQAATHYKNALQWFRDIRSRKETLDLFAVPDNVKAVSAPAGPTTSLDVWSRIVYRKPGPREIINRNTAAWYPDDRERECFLAYGFICMLNRNFEEAAGIFRQIALVDKDARTCAEKGIPNLLWRLESACNIQYMVFPMEESKFLKGRNQMYCSYAEFNYLAEKFDFATGWFRRIIENPASSDVEKAIGLIGLGACMDVMRSDSRKSLEEDARMCFEKALKLAGKTPVAGNAAIRLGCLSQSSSLTFNDSEQYFKEYLTRYKNGRYEDKALFRLAYLYSTTNRNAEGTRLLSKMEKDFPESFYLPRMREIFKNNNK